MTSSCKVFKRLSLSFSIEDMQVLRYLRVFSRLSSYYLSSIVKKREYRVCVKHIIRGGGGVYYSLWPRGEENSLSFGYIKSECPGLPWGGGWGFKWLDWCSDPFFKSCKNDKRNSDLFFKVIRKRETKFKSFFQSNAKRKNEKQNSYPFFKVMRKRKTKYEVQNRFSKLGENEKQKAKF